MTARLNSRPSSSSSFVAHAFYGVLSCLLLVGCTALTDFDRQSFDGGGNDGETPDVVEGDSGPDAETTDAASRDSGLTDAGLTDAGGSDAGGTDAGPSDAAVGDGSVSDGATPDASLTDGGPDVRPCAETCSGCCTDDGACVEPPDSLQCGTSGSSCVACDANVADTCSAAGECACGGGAACGAGQRCFEGSCICDATSCSDGCCTGNVCTPVSNSACGFAGQQCNSCPSPTVCVPSTAGGGFCDCAPPSQTGMPVVYIDAGSGRQQYTGTPIEVDPGAPMTFDGQYQIYQGCPGCVILFTAGWATPGYGHEYFSCTNAGVPGACSNRTGNVGLANMVAPNTPGIYQIRANTGGFFVCGDAQTWFNGFRVYNNSPVVAEIEVRAGTGCHRPEVTSVDFGGAGNDATVTAGTNVNVSIDFDYYGNTGSTIDQVVFGFVGPDGAESFICPYTGITSSCTSTPRSGSGVFTPTTPGTYELRWYFGQYFNCTDALAGFEAFVPPRSHTVGVLHVE